MTAEFDALDDRDHDVLGEPPSLPDHIWERMLDVAVAAPEGAGAELVPDGTASSDDGAQEPGPGGSGLDVDERDLHGLAGHDLDGHDLDGHDLDGHGSDADDGALGSGPDDESGFGGDAGSSGQDDPGGVGFDGLV